MPIRYRIDEALGIVLTEIEGPVNAEELRQHATALLSDPAAEGLDELVDLSERQTVTTSARDLRGMASMFRRRPPSPRRKKLALVASNDAVFGMARVYAGHREDESIEVEVFRHRAEALQWLGIG